MAEYILRRLLVTPMMVLGVTILVFVMYNLAPGDPVTAMIDPLEPTSSQIDREAMRERLGLNKPIHVRYLIWLRELLRGNLGYSQVDGHSVAERIAQTLPATLLLQATSLVLAILIGVALGLVSGLKQYSNLDHALSFFAFFGISVPNFFVAILLMYFLSVKLDWFPLAGMWTPGQSTGFNLDLLHHMVLPVLANVILSLAGYMRYTRASVLDALGADYVTTARSKGLPERWVIIRHVFRNALLPVVTLVGLSLPSLLGGSFILEQLFSWPGMGRLGYTALLARDYPVIMAVTLTSAVIVMLANLASDIAYGFVDPRVRYD